MRGLRLKQCGSWLQERLQGVHQQNYSSSHYNLAPKLKKLAKAYGFEYFYRGNGIYILKLQTKNGHFFHLVAQDGNRYLLGWEVRHRCFHGLCHGEVVGLDVHIRRVVADGQTCHRAYGGLSKVPHHRKRHHIRGLVLTIVWAQWKQAC